MTDSLSPIQNVSDTAFWVAYYRALETERPDALFHDPLARQLVDERAERIAASMKATAAQTRHNVLIRTVIIDRYIQKLVTQSGVDLVVNLGAGLDTRPYRLQLPTSLRWVEVDYPHLIQFKQQRLAQERPGVLLERVQLDLADRAQRQQLFRSLSSSAAKVVILTEGVLPYLTQDQVAELAEDLHACRNFQYWIADYISPAVYKYLQTPARMRALKNAPFKFYPADWFGFFKTRGWSRDTVEYIGEESLKLRRSLPVPWWSYLFAPFMSKATKQGFLRASGYMILGRQS
ncbi:MAG: SAM-dependent methyltransferase [Steroidobacteraceae bacterium]